MPFATGRSGFDLCFLGVVWIIVGNGAGSRRDGVLQRWQAGSSACRWLIGSQRLIKTCFHPSMTV